MGLKMKNLLLDPIITYIIGLIIGGLWVYSFMKGI